MTPSEAMTQRLIEILSDKVKTAGTLVECAEIDLEQPGGPDCEQLLRDLYMLSETVASATRTAVSVARDAGMSWNEIGHQLGGITKQGVQQRYSDNRTMHGRWSELGA